MNGLVEILKTKEWAIAPEYLKGAVKLITDNLRNHTELGKFEKTKPYAVIRNESDTAAPMAYVATRNGDDERSSWDAADMRQPFVDVLTIDGPITRGGGACSYGSKDIREQMMMCADNPFCIGHVLYVDTQGGSAWAINDFKQAIDYAHERGQRVIMSIDGDCFSAGMWLASLCDEIYVMNEADEMGCIGVLASFFTLKNGAHNEFSAEDYHEIYDPESYDKNRLVRDVSDDDNDKLLVEMLSKTGVEFREAVMRAFPNASDDMIHGKTFPASEVMGVFCDGVKSKDECIARLFAIYDRTETPIERTNFINANSNQMNIFERFRAATNQIEKEAQEQGFDGANAEEVAKLNEQIAELQKQNDEAQASITSLTTERDELKEAAAKSDETIANLQEQVNNLTAEKEQLTEKATSLENDVEGKDKEIEDLKGQLGSNYQPGNRMSGQPAGEQKNVAEMTSEERLNECRDKLGWNKKK